MRVVDNCVNKKVIEISFDIPIEPVPAARPRFTKYGHAYDPKKPRIFKKQVAMFVESKLKQIKIELDMKAPKVVSINFYRRNQKNISNIEHKRRQNRTSMPIVKPDIDNYFKSTLDAMEGLLWHDDAQVVRIKSTKYYDDRPHIIFDVKDWDKNEN